MTALSTIGIYFGLIFGLSLFFGVPKLIQEFLSPKKVSSNEYENIESNEENQTINMGMKNESENLNEDLKEPILFDYSEDEFIDDWNEEDREDVANGEIEI